MSPKPTVALVRNSALLTFAAIIAANCAEPGLGPRETSLRALTAGAVKLRGECTVSWASPVSGMWSDGTKWSGGVVPGPDDEVCITIDGTYTVTARGTQSAFGLRVGADGNAGVQTLMVQGSPGLAALLTVGDGIENRSVIRVRGNGNGAGACTLAVTNGELRNEASGLVETFGGCGVTPAIAANVLNDGTFTVGGNLDLNRADGRYVNNGTFRVEVIMQVRLTNNPTFVQAGTLEIIQANGFLQTGGAFEWIGGAIVTGSPRLNGTALLIPESSTGQGLVTMHGSTTITGDVHAEQIVLVQGVGDPGDATMTGTAAFSNSGIIQLAGAGNGAGGCTIVAPNGALTNESDGLIEVLGGCGVTPTLSGEIVNLGTIDIVTTVAQVSQGTLRSVTPGTIVGGHQLKITGSGAFFGSGALTSDFRNEGQFNVGQSPGLLTVDGTFTQTSTGAFNAELGGPTPGTEFDVVQFGGGANLGGTLNVSSVNGTCVAPGVFEIMTFSARGGDFTTKNAINLAPGQTLTTQPAAKNYTVTVSGAACPLPDGTPPVVIAQVTGQLGNNDWYVNNVTVSWQVSDAESAISSQTGCTETQVTDDTAGITFTCSATSAGGTTSQGVTIKRDATPPVVGATRAPSANANGWNNTDVTATYIATDAMSGVDGSAAVTQIFATEGANQGGSQVFVDRADNSATATVTGINIRATEPPPPPPLMLACSATPAELRPPNGQMVPVTVTITSTSDLAGATITLLSATSNEANSGHGPDIQDFVVGTNDLAGLLRATRRSSGTGRLYTLSYEVTTSGQQRGECTVIVSVPLDHRVQRR